MLGRFAHFLLKKNSHAALVAFLCGILPIFFVTISIVIVALVTLRKGLQQGFFVLAWGILPLLARAFVDKSDLLFAATIIAFVLVWGMAIILRRYASWSVLLQIVALLGVCVVLLAHFFQENIVQWWAVHISDSMQLMLNDHYITANEILPHAQVLWLAQFASGVEVLLLLLVASLKLALARWWQGKTFKAVDFRKELLHTRFDWWALFLFALLLGIAITLKTMLFVDALIPLVGLYSVAGLCLLHDWMQGYQYARSALMGFYIVLILFPYVLILILFLGLVDSGLNLRMRIKEV